MDLSDYVPFAGLQAPILNEISIALTDFWTQAETTAEIQSQISAAGLLTQAQGDARYFVVNANNSFESLVRTNVTPPMIKALLAPSTLALWGQPPSLGTRPSSSPAMLLPKPKRIRASKAWATRPWTPATSPSIPSRRAGPIYNLIQGPRGLHLLGHEAHLVCRAINSVVILRLRPPGLLGTGRKFVLRLSSDRFWKP